MSTRCDYFIVVGGREMTSSYIVKRWQLGLLTVIAVASDVYHVFVI